MKREFLEDVKGGLPWLNKVQGRATFVDIETTALRPKAPLGAIWEAGAARRTTPKDIAAQMEKGIYGPYLEDVNTLVQPLVHKRTPEGEVTYGEQIPQEELSPWTKGSIENEARTKLETRRDYGTTTGSPLVDQMVDEAKSSGKSLEPLVGDIYQSQLNRLYGQGVMPTLANVPAAELEGFFGKGPIHPTEMLGQLYGSMRGRDVWIQNLKFESSWLGELTPREQWENWVKEGKLQTFGWLESMEEQQTRAAGHKPGLPQGRMFQTAPKIDTAVSRAFETGKLEDWESVFTKGFMPELEGIRPEGMTRILDSQTLSQSIFAMAQQRGYMRKSYDVFTGTNINILNYLLTGNREAHRAFMDASVTGNIVDWMLIQGKAMAEGRPISEFAERFFSTMGHIQPMMKERAQVKTLAGAYHQLLEGEPWEAVTAYEPRLKDVFGWEGEDVKWLGQKMVNIRKTKNLASIEDVVGFLKERQAFTKRGNVDYDRILALTQEEIIGPAVAAAEGPEGLAKSVFKQMGAWDKATEEELVQYASKYAEGGAGFWGRMARKGGRAAPYLLGAGALVLGAHALFGGPKEPETRPAPVGGLGLASMLGPWAPIASKADIVRASSLGKSPLDLYNYMTGAEEPVSDFAKVSMTTGTALHQLLQQQGWAQGNVAETEQFVYDPVNQVTGHLDVRFKTGEVIDIKTVSPKRWRAIQEGPDPEHIPQTNFYGIMTGAPYVGIQYVRADKPEMTKLYTFTPSEEMYQASMAKVNRVRQLVEEEGSASYYSPLLARLGDIQDKLTPKGNLLENYQRLLVNYRQARLGKAIRPDGEINALDRQSTRKRRDFGSGYQMMGKIGQEAMEEYLSKVMVRNDPMGWDEPNEYVPTGFRARISGRDDQYNVLEAFQHKGWAGANRGYQTDFGSGYNATKQLLLKTTPLIDWFRKEAVKLGEGFSSRAYQFGDIAVKAATEKEANIYRLLSDIPGVPTYLGTADLTPNARKALFEGTNLGRAEAKFHRNIPDKILMMEHLDAKPLSKASEWITDQTWTDIENAVQEMHQRNIVHRDLAARNLLVSPEGRGHVVDFGEAQHITQYSSVQKAMAKANDIAKLTETRQNILINSRIEQDLKTAKTQIKYKNDGHTQYASKKAMVVR